MKKNNLIREILISNWDPINIGDNKNLWDEYDRYVYAIIEMSKKPLLNSNILEKYLEGVEVKIIGIKTTPKIRKVVAKKILGVLLSQKRNDA